MVIGRHTERELGIIVYRRPLLHQRLRPSRCYAEPRSYSAQAEPSLCTRGSDSDAAHGQVTCSSHHSTQLLLCLSVPSQYVRVRELRRYIPPPNEPSRWLRLLDSGVECTGTGGAQHHRPDTPDLVWRQAEADRSA